MSLTSFSRAGPRVSSAQIMIDFFAANADGTARADTARAAAAIAPTTPIRFLFIFPPNMYENPRGYGSLVGLFHNICGLRSNETLFK